MRLEALSKQNIRSDKDSLTAVSKHFGLDKNEEVKAKRVSLSRLFKLEIPDWIAGIFGTMGGIFAGAQMPLFALGVTQGLVAMYDIDYSATKSKYVKFAYFFVVSHCSH